MLGNLDFTLALEPEAEGGLTVVVPALPKGHTEADGMAMAEEAIRTILAHRRHFGIRIQAS